MQPDQADQHDPAELLTVRQVADLCGLNSATVRFWINSGRLQAHDLSGLGGGQNGSRYRIGRSELRRFIDDCKLTRPNATKINLEDEK